MTEADVLRTHIDLFNGALKSRDWDQLAAIYSEDYMCAFTGRSRS